MPVPQALIMPQPPANKCDTLWCDSSADEQVVGTGCKMLD